MANILFVTNPMYPFSEVVNFLDNVITDHENNNITQAYNYSESDVSSGAYDILYDFRFADNGTMSLNSGNKDAIKYMLQNNKSVFVLGENGGSVYNQINTDIKNLIIEMGGGTSGNLMATPVGSSVVGTGAGGSYATIQNMGGTPYTDSEIGNVAVDYPGQILATEVGNGTAIAITQKPFNWAGGGSDDATVGILFRGDTDLGASYNGNLIAWFDWQAFGLSGFQEDKELFLDNIDKTLKEPRTILVVAYDDNASTNNLTPITIHPLDNDSGVGLTITSITQPSGAATASVSADNKSIHFDPNGEFGTKFIDYEVEDVNGVPGGPGTITINISQTIEVNGLTVVTYKNQSLKIFAFNNDIFSAAVLSDGIPTPLHGSVGLSNPNSNFPMILLSPQNDGVHYFTYTPDSEFVGVDQFEYTLTDTSDSGNTSTAIVTIYVLDPNNTDDDLSDYNGSFNFSKQKCNATKRSQLLPAQSLIVQHNTTGDSMAKYKNNVNFKFRRQINASPLDELSRLAINKNPLKLLVNYDNRYWNMDNGNAINYYNNEHPTIECEFDISTALTDLSIHFKEHGALPDVKKYIQIIASAGIESRNKKDIESTIRSKTSGNYSEELFEKISNSDNSIIFEIFNNEISSWEQFNLSKDSNPKLAGNTIFDNLYISNTENVTNVDGLKYQKINLKYYNEETGITLKNYTGTELTDKILLLNNFENIKKELTYNAAYIKVNDTDSTILEAYILVEDDDGLNIYETNNPSIDPNKIYKTGISICDNVEYDNSYIYNKILSNKIVQHINKELIQYTTLKQSGSNPYINDNSKLKIRVRVSPKYAAEIDGSFKDQQYYISREAGDTLNPKKRRINPGDQLPNVVTGGNPDRVWVDNTGNVDNTIDLNKVKYVEDILSMHVTNFYIQST